MLYRFTRAGTIAGAVCYLLALSAWARAQETAAPTATAVAGAPTATVSTAKPCFLRLTRNDEGDAIALETAVVSYEPRGPADPAPAATPVALAEDVKTEAARSTADADGDDKPAETQAAAGDKPAEPVEPFAPPADLVVDLFGAVHIGERAYYEQINREFKQYDVVLYELVAPPGTRIPKGGAASAHPVAMLQGGMKSMLGLESQTELVDYHAENLVHADMSPEELNRSMEARGDGFIAMFFRMMGQSIAQQSREQILRQNGAKLPRRASQTDLLAALLNPSRGSGGLKQMMAEQFENMEATMLALEGPKGSSLISERNKVALAALREQVKAGKRRIAIFYGAGHLPDFERRLLTEYGLKRAGERWLLAWDLKSVPQAASKRPSDTDEKQGDDPQQGESQPAEAAAAPGN